MRGVFDEVRYQRELDLVRATLARQDAPHWREFLEAWPQSPIPPRSDVS